MTICGENRTGQIWGSVFFAAVLLGLVVLPVVNMFSCLRPEDFERAAADGRFFAALFNSVVLSGTATVLVLVMAGALAWCMTGTRMAGKRLYDFVFVLPMLIPSISHGTAIILLFGRNGLFSRLLHWDMGVNGAVGIVLGSVMYAFPVAYIMLLDVLRYEDRSVYEAAEVLGISRWQQFTHITLPFLRKPVLAVASCVFSMIITDYGVPVAVGGTVQTISRLMYDACVGFEQDLGKGCVLGAILLVPALVAFLADLMSKDRAEDTFAVRAWELRASPVRDWLAKLVSTVMALLFFFPVIAFLVVAFTKSYPYNLELTLDNVAGVFQRGGAEYLRNSLEIAFLTASVGTLFAGTMAYMAVRLRTKAARALHLVLLSTLTVPGMVFGLSYLMTFHDTALSGTLSILVMVNLVHFIGSPYLMMCNSFRKLNENLEAVGQTLGISRARLVRDVVIPQSLGTIGEMFTYFFVNCMMTISAVAFLNSAGTKPMSLMINQFGGFRLGCTAVVSLVILLVNVVVRRAVGHLAGSAAEG